MKRTILTLLVFVLATVAGFAQITRDQLTGGIGSSKTWYLQREGIAMGLGPAPGDNSYWSLGGVSQLSERPCVLDDSHTFFDDGTWGFQSNNTLFVDATQFGGWLDPEGCRDESEPGLFVGPLGEDLSAFANGGAYNFTYDEITGTVTINGLGNYIGLAVKNNDGDSYLPVESKVYTIESFERIGTADYMLLTMQSGLNYWNFYMVSYDNPADLPPMPIGIPGPYTLVDEFGQDMISYDGNLVTQDFSAGFFLIDGNGQSWGDNEGDGILELSGAAMIPPPGLQGFRLIDNTYSFTPINSVGILGDATPTGWDFDTDMAYLGGGQFELTSFPLAGGFWKIRANDDWGINWGDNESDGFFEHNGADIPVGVPGNYTINVDITNYTYSIMLESDPGSQSLAGTFDVTTNAWCGNTFSGQFTWVDDGNDFYSVDGGDFSYGGYDACYGDGTPGSAGAVPAGNLQIRHVGSNLEPVGTSQWGETYWFNSVTTDGGSSLTIDWANDYGEAGITTLTRTDGLIWDDLLGTASNTVFFEKPDFADWTLPENQDFITPNVILTRADQQGLFNIALESSYTGFSSPAGTLWQLGTSESVYLNSGGYVSWQDAVGSNPPSAVGNTYSVWLPDEGRYFDINFTSWTSGPNGGGLAYYRTEYFPPPPFEPVDYMAEISASEFSHNFTSGVAGPGVDLVDPQGEITYGVSVGGRLATEFVRTDANNGVSELRLASTDADIRFDNNGIYEYAKAVIDVYIPSTNDFSGSLENLFEIILGDQSGMGPDANGQCLDGSCWWNRGVYMEARDIPLDQWVTLEFDLTRRLDDLDAPFGIRDNIDLVILKFGGSLHFDFGTIYLSNFRFDLVPPAGPFYPVTFDGTAMAGPVVIERPNYRMVTHFIDGTIQFTGADGTIYGDNEGDGILDIGGTPIPVLAGDFRLNVDPVSLGYFIAPVESIGLLGTARGGDGWNDPDTDMMNMGNGIYTLTGIELFEGEWKVRVNDDWGFFNWGDSDGDGFLDPFGANIYQPEGGFFNVTIDIINNTYLVEPYVSPPFNVATLSQPGGKVWRLGGDFYRVGPAPGSGDWWPGPAGDPSRGCQYDDEFIFFDDGTLRIDNQSSTFLEDRTGGSFNCADPAASPFPYNGFVSGDYGFSTFDDGINPVQITTSGQGAYLGFNLPYNGGEYSGSDTELVSSITYDVINYIQVDNRELLEITIDFVGDGSGYWTITLESFGEVPGPDVVPPPVAGPVTCEDYWIGFNGGNYSHPQFDDLGNVYVVGGNGNDFHMLKYDIDGNLINSHRLNADILNLVPSIAIDGDFIYLTASYRSANFGDGDRFSENATPFVAKYDLNFNLHWVHDFPSDGFSEAMDVDTDSEGNVYITGRFRNRVDIGGESIFGGSQWTPLIKLNSAGDLIWYRYSNFTDAAGNDATSRGWAMDIDDQNSIYISGYFSFEMTFGGDMITSFNPNNPYIAKFDRFGNNLWIRGFPTDGTFQTMYDVKADNLGNVYGTGVHFNSVDTDGDGAPDHFANGGSGSDILLVKLDAFTGSTIWAWSFGGANNPANEWAGALDIYNGNPVVAGQMRSDDNIFAIDAFGASYTNDGPFLNFVAQYDATNGQLVNFFEPVAQDGAIYGASVYGDYVFTTHTSQAGISKNRVDGLGADTRFLSVTSDGPFTFPQGSFATVNANIGGLVQSYEWYRDGQLYSTEAQLTVIESGDYSLSVVNETGCYVQSVNSLFFEVFQESLETDRIVLEEFYNAFGGDGWTNSWDLTQPIETWFGVTILNGRVTGLNLSYNNLFDQGQFVNMQKLTALQSINLEGNAIGNLWNVGNLDLLPVLTDVNLAFNNAFDMPNLSGSGSIINLAAQNNDLRFQHLEPNASIVNFTYAPQNVTAEGYCVTGHIGQDVELNAAPNFGEFTTYSWNTGETGFSIFRNVQATDFGIYTVTATNSQLPGLAYTVSIDLAPPADPVAINTAIVYDSESTLGALGVFGSNTMTFEDLGDGRYQLSDVTGGFYAPFGFDPNQPAIIAPTCDGYQIESANGAQFNIVANGPIVFGPDFIEIPWFDVGNQFAEVTVIREAVPYEMYGSALFGNVLPMSDNFFYAQPGYWFRVAQLTDGTIGFRKQDGSNDTGEIHSVAAGVYAIRYNPGNGEVWVDPIESVGFLGSARPGVEWADPDWDMVNAGNGVYYLDGLVLQEGFWKIRANDDWNFANWGDNEGDGFFEYGGADIYIPQAGTYYIEVDIVNDTYFVNLLSSGGCETAMFVDQGTYTAGPPQWFAYQSPGYSQDITISSVGLTGSDTYLKVYNDCGAIDPIFEVDDVNGTAQSELSLTLFPFETIYILWDNVFSEEPFEWTIYNNGSGCFGAQEATAGINQSPETPAWFFYVAPEDQDITITSVGYTTTDTYLKIFDDCLGDPVAVNDDFDGLQSQLTGTMLAGETIYFLWDNDYDFQPFEFEIITSTTGTGNTCADAILIDQGSYTAPSQPYWYEYIAYENQDVTISSIGSGVNTYLRLYDACGTTPFAENDDVNLSGESELVLSMTAGQSIFIEWVDAYNVDAFSFTVTSEVVVNPCLDAPFVGLGQHSAAAPQWFRYKADFDQTAVISSVPFTTSDTYLKIFNSCGDEVPVAENDNATGTLASEVEIALVTDQVIYIFWDGSNSTLPFNWSIDVPNDVRQTQTVTFDAIPDKSFGDAPFTLTASASSGLPIQYVVTQGGSAVSVTSGLVTIIGTGQVTIEARQAGDDLWLPASASQSFTVGKATASVNIENTEQTWDGSPKEVTVSTFPTGLTVNVTYNGSSIAPSDAGNYTVLAVIDNNLYQGEATATLTINPATVTFTITNTEQVYDGSPKSVDVSASPDVAYVVTYDGSETLPVDAGGYAVNVAVDPSLTNYTGGASDQLTISKASATVTIDAASLNQVYDGTERAVSVTTDPAGLSLIVTYDGAETPAVDVGIYAVVAEIVDNNYEGSDAGELTVTKGEATVTIDAASLSQDFDGDPKPVTVTTLPAGLNVIITYDGNTDAPVNAADYTVEVTIDDANWEGSTSGTLTINPGLLLGADLEKAVKVYPNPATEVINLTYPAGSGQGWMISDISGKVVARGSLSGSSHKIDVTEFAPGIYHLELRTSDATGLFKVVIK